MTASWRERRDHLLGNARRSPFVASIAVLSGAGAVGAILALAATPLISRLYTPAEFGVLGVFAAALSLVSVLATLRYDMAIPASSSDAGAASVLVVALTTAFVTSILCGLLVYTGVMELIIPATAGHRELLRWALPLGMAAVGIYGALSSWMVRRRDFVTLGKTKLIQVIAMVGSQVGLGIVGAGPVGLVAGQIAGSSMGIVRLTRKIAQADRAAFAGLRPRSVRTSAREFRRYPLLSGPAVLCDALTGALPLLALAAQFGPGSAGLYTIVQRVVFAPLALVTTSLAQIIFGDLAVLQRTSSSMMSAVFYRRLRQITLLGLGTGAVLIVAVPVALPTVLGAQWSEATRYFLILLPMVLAGFIAAPFGFAVDVLRRQDLHLLRDSSRAATLIIALAIAKARGFDVTWTLAMISASGCLNGLIYLAISWYAISSSDGDLRLTGDEDVTALGAKQ